MKKTMIRTTPAALLVTLAALTLAPLARADEAASDVHLNNVRLGMYFVRYSASASDLSGPFTPPGINLKVNSVNTPFFAYIRTLSPKWDLEFAGGVPPKTHTIGVGPASLGSVPFNGQEVATAKWFSPSILLEYKFLEQGSALRPYVGAGFNYTHFYDRNSTAAGDAANGGPTKTNLSDSLGLAATAGLAYNFTKSINATVSYSMAQVNSDYVSDTAGILRKTTVHFNPRTLVVAVGYSF